MDVTHSQPAQGENPSAHTGYPHPWVTNVTRFMEAAHARAS